LALEEKGELQAAKVIILKIIDALGLSVDEVFEQLDKMPKFWDDPGDEVKLYL